MNDSPQLSKKAIHSAKMRVKVHEREPSAYNKYMIGNAFGFIAGGNLRKFVSYDEMTLVTYPTVFPTKRLASAHLLNDSAYIADIELFCAENADSYNIVETKQKEVA